MKTKKGLVQVISFPNFCVSVSWKNFARLPDTNGIGPVRVNAAFNDNGVEYVWILDKSHFNITPRVCKLQTSTPIVIFDVNENESLNYSLGIKTSDVMEKSSQKYSKNTCAVIKFYAEIILDSYNRSK